MIRIAVCDDNKDMMNELSRLIVKALSEHFEDNNDFSVREFTNAIVMLTEHSANPFDAVFLDIDMPRVTGFDAALHLENEKKKCYIVFVTNHEELVYDSMNYHPFQFIRKVCDTSLDESVYNVIRQLMENIEKKKVIFLNDRSNGKLTKAVYIQDIIYIESRLHYLLYHICGNNETIEVRGKMSDCEGAYDEYDFVRIHKGYYINMRYLASYSKSEGRAYLKKTNDCIPVGEKYKKELDRRYALYLRKTL